MITFIAWFDAFLRVLRSALFIVGVVLAVVCLLDWLVRTRRINPFNPIARRMRATVDPLMAPMERRVVRAGGMPTSAPWWTLIVAVVGAIILLWLLDHVRAGLLLMARSSQDGAWGLLALLIHWTFQILRTAIIVRVVSSWIRISPYSPWVRWAFQLTEWFMDPLRRVIPTIGVIDITPIVAYFLLVLIEGALFGVLRLG